ncbi:MAG: nitroreductase family protein [archaeon]
MPIYTSLLLRSEGSQLLETLDTIRTRSSIRDFDRDEVEPKMLSTILEAGTRAPSAGNRQPWEFVIVRNEQGRHALAAAAYGQEFVGKAPVVIVVCANVERSAARYGDRGAQLYCLQDTAAAIQNILLAAHSLGLGGCWVGAFDEDAVAKIIRSPAKVRPVAIIPIGKPVARSNQTPRMSLERVVYRERFDTKYCNGEPAHRQRLGVEKS